MSGMDVAAGICLIIGCLMSLGAGIGIVRFPDVLTRLHAGAKPQVFGLFMLLLGVGLAARSWALVPLLVFVWVLQLVVIPVSSHMVSRSGFRNKHFRPESLSHNELADLVQRMSEDDAQRADAGNAPQTGADDAGVREPGADADADAARTGRSD